MRLLLAQHSFALEVSVAALQLTSPMCPFNLGKPRQIQTALSPRGIRTTGTRNKPGFRCGRTNGWFEYQRSFGDKAHEARLKDVVTYVPVLDCQKGHQLKRSHDAIFLHGDLPRRSCAGRTTFATSRAGSCILRFHGRRMDCPTCRDRRSRLPSVEKPRDRGQARHCSRHLSALWNSSPTNSVRCFHEVAIRGEGEANIIANEMEQSLKIVTMACIDLRQTLSKVFDVLMIIVCKQFHLLRLPAQQPDDLDARQARSIAFVS